MLPAGHSMAGDKHGFHKMEVSDIAAIIIHAITKFDSSRRGLTGSGAAIGSRWDSGR